MIVYLTLELMIPVYRPAADIVAGGLGYFRVVRDSLTHEYGHEWVTSGDPATDLLAVRYSLTEGTLPLALTAGEPTPVEPPPVVTPPPPPATLVWEPPPDAEISAATGRITIRDRNFRLTVNNRAMFSNWRHRITFINCRFDSGFFNNNICGGFGLNVEFFNCLFLHHPPTVYGRSSEPIVRGREMKYFRMEGCTVPYMGGGFVVSGFSKGHARQFQFSGNPANGDGVFLLRNRFRNVDGRRSNGAGGYIKSGIGLAHYNSTSSTGTAIRANGGVVGFDIRNLIQFLNMPQCPQIIEDNEMLNDLDCVHEDLLSYFGGSGGSAEYPAYVRRNLLENVSRYDWNSTKQPGSGYQADGMVRLNSDGYQPTNDFTKASDTCILVGDENRTDSYDFNTSYVIVEENWAFGHRPMITLHNGHHNEFHRNRLYMTDRHRTGVLYTGVREGYYEIRDRSNGGKTTAGQTIWGFNQFFGQSMYKGTAAPYREAGAPAQIFNNGGDGDAIYRYPDPLDGGAALIEEWRAMQIAAGRTIGCTLPGVA